MWTATLICNMQTFFIQFDNTKRNNNIPQWEHKQVQEVPVYIKYTVLSLFNHTLLCTHSYATSTCNSFFLLFFFSFFLTCFVVWGKRCDVTGEGWNRELQDLAFLSVSAKHSRTSPRAWMMPLFSRSIAVLLPA